MSANDNQFDLGARLFEFVVRFAHEDTNIGLAAFFFHVDELRAEWSYLPPDQQRATRETLDLLRKSYGRIKPRGALELDVSNQSPEEALRALKAISEKYKPAGAGGNIEPAAPDMVAALHQQTEERLTRLKKKVTNVQNNLMSMSGITSDVGSKFALRLLSELLNDE